MTLRNAILLALLALLPSYLAAEPVPPSRWRSQVAAKPTEKLTKTLRIPTGALERVLLEGEEAGILDPEARRVPAFFGPKVVLSRPSPTAGRYQAPRLTFIGGPKSPFSGELLFDRVVGADRLEVRVDVTLRLKIEKEGRSLVRDLRLALRGTPEGLELIWSGPFPILALRSRSWRQMTATVRRGKLRTRLRRRSGAWSGS
jgi:hypothetical protein